MFTADVDIRGFNRFVSGLQNALIGTGQEGALFDVVKSEVKQLSLEISRELGPRTLAIGEKRISRDIRGTFAPGPVPAFSGRQRGGDKGINWLFAGPTFLIGTKSDDPYPEPGAMTEALRFDLNHGGRGKKIISLGVRGKQHVRLLNRWVVANERIEQLMRRLALRIGRLRASFALAAKQLGFDRVPVWISRHFDAVRLQGIGIFRYHIEGNEVKAIEFGSRAPGVVSNERIQRHIHNAIQARRYAVNAKMNAVLGGYTYDWNTGKVFFKNRGREILAQLEANEAMYEAL